jgi:primosomal protein N'
VELSGGDFVARQLKPGMQVRVPWGLDEDRLAVIVEIWGPPHSPSQIKIRFIDDAKRDDPGTLLISPRVASPVPAA